MGLETIAIIAVVAISVATAVYATVAMPKSKANQKQEIGTFQVTRAEEGQVIPIVYGTVRVPGSIIWYGNIKYYTTSSGGGKGGGGGGGASVTRVYCDAHLVLCEGKITLDQVYKDEEVYEYEASITFNDGTTSSYVNYAEYATKLPGISHIYFQTWYLGENQNSIPSLSFKVTRVLTTPISSTVTTGENPACIVYDILDKAGATIDTASFQEVADLYNLRNWGLNLVFDKQEEISKMLETIFSHVDLLLYREAGTYYLRQTHEPTFAMEVLEKDMLDLVFTRVAYNQVFNDLAANYKDANNTDRTVRLINEAVYAITGEQKNHSYDLKGFNNLDVVKYRFSEIHDRETYPISEINFKTSLKYYDLLLGDLIQISYDLYGVVNKLFLVTKILKNPFSNQMEITAREYAATPSNYIYFVGTPTGSGTVNTPEDLSNVSAIEFRYLENREFNGKVPVLILPCKENGHEYAYDVYYSRDNVNFIYLATSYSFSYSGTLQEEYPNNTYDIDDEIGILIDYDETNYALDDLTREELFTTKRVGVIGSEIFKFQEATVEGDNIRLTGILRKEKAIHAASSIAYFTEIGDNVFDVPITNQLYFKICPKTRRGTLDLASASSIAFTPSITIDAPTRLLATRSGGSVVLEIWPSTQINSGCGIGDADIVSDTVPHPFDFIGNLIVTVGTNSPVTIRTSTYSFTDALEVEVKVRQQAYGFFSSEKTLTVGASDGKYIS